MGLSGIEIEPLVAIDAADDNGIDIIWYICQLQLGKHPVAVVQYTFTDKQ